MSLYELPEVKIPNFLKRKILWIFVLVIFTSSLFGFLGGTLSGGFFYLQVKDYLSKLDIRLPALPGRDATTSQEYVPQTTQEEAIISVVKEVSPAVVSIVITKDVPIMEQYYITPFQDVPIQIPQYRQNGTEKQEIGGGTGFIISQDGMILTNKHVAIDKEADYTVFTNDGKSYLAKVLARDPVQDLAILKIDQEKVTDNKGSVGLKSFSVVKLGDSDKLQSGQTVIAIGNALGEFRNTVSVGVVSGLSRSITASGGGLVETLEDVIQTDAAINKGNSGGPLLNLRGEVIGVNAAMVEQAQSIGFSIPINKAKRAISQVEKSGKIVYPFLGVRYVLVNSQLQKEKSLSVDYGALIIKGDAGEPAVEPNSGAAKAGLREGDILLEFNGEKITTENSLSKIIAKYNPGDSVAIKFLRSKEEKTVQVVLSERK